MRRSLFLYLFVFAALIVVFQYVTSKRMLTAKDREIEKLEIALRLANQQKENLASPKVNDRFLFTSNDQAMSYFEEQGMEASEVVSAIEEEIISRNHASQDNDLVPYEGMEGNMRINSIRILNHKWILADFTDGNYWGELFLTYTIDEEGRLNIETEKSLFYPQG